MTRATRKGEKGTDGRSFLFLSGVSHLKNSLEVCFFPKWGEKKAGDISSNVSLKRDSAKSVKQGPVHSSKTSDQGQG